MLEGKCNDFTEIYIYILSLSGSKYCVGHHMTPTMGYQGGGGGSAILSLNYKTFIRVTKNQSLEYFFREKSLGHS